MTTTAAAAAATPAATPSPTPTMMHAPRRCSCASLQMPGSAMQSAADTLMLGADVSAHAEPMTVACSCAQLMCLSAA